MLISDGNANSGMDKQEKWTTMTVQQTHGAPCIVANNPVWVSLCKFRVLVSSKWCKPNTWLHAVRSHGVRQTFHACVDILLGRIGTQRKCRRKSLGLERTPVTPSSHVSVINQANIGHDFVTDWPTKRVAIFVEQNEEQKIGQSPTLATRASQTLNNNRLCQRYCTK